MAKDAVNTIARRCLRPCTGRSAPTLLSAVRGLSVVVALTLCFATAANAAAPVWRMDVSANPTAAPGTQVQYAAAITNIGDASAPVAAGGDSNNCTAGSPPPSDSTKCYTITASFPAGITPVATTTNMARCAIDAGTNSVTCSTPGNFGSQQVAPWAVKTLTVTANVDPAASGTFTTSWTASGAGAGTDTTVKTTTVSADPPRFGAAAFDAQVTADAAGSALTQAGGHPYAASTAIEFNSVTDPNPFVGALWPVEPEKDVIVDLPPGFIGNPTVVDQCTTPELANTIANINPQPLCPATSQVGTTLVRTPARVGTGIIGPIPVFMMVPPPDVPARFGFNVLGTVVTLDAELRSNGDYGLSAVVRNIPQGVAIQSTELTLWGVPSDPGHDSERACPGQSAPSSRGPTCASGAPRRAFLRNPTSCTPDGVGLPTTLRVDSWTHPGAYVSTSIESHLPPGYPFAPGDWGRAQGPKNCDRVPFDPSLSATPAAGVPAGQPAGFSFDLSLPQTDDPDVIATGDLKKAVVTLPQGVRVSPASADGLAACSPAQIGLRTREDPTCPEASKLGSVTIDTPLLRVPLQGALYLATPFDNPFNSLVAVYLVASGPGVIVKLAGHVSLDASKDGQITTTFDDNPQTPFSRLHLEFKGGSRAPLALPTRCGTYTTHAQLTSWSGRTVSTDSRFTVSNGCGTGFDPTWAAGTINPVAGKTSPFLVRVTRSGLDQQLSGLTVAMPTGLTGYISKISLCSDAQASAGTCDEASRVGSVTVGAGAGTTPFYITNGRAYLTGPYRGAPYGLSIVVPAVAGPFDLGTVVVRAAIYVDKHNASLRVVSDPLPTVLQGIPLDVRDVRVNVDRSGFTLNPTNCAEKSVNGVISSTQGATAKVSSRFQVGECAGLRFRPRMVLRVGGRGHVGRGRTTPLITVLRMPSTRQANLRYVRVALPTSINARLTVINDACTREEFESDIAKCAHAEAGTARAVTPLLRHALKGRVYFVKNGHAIPDLFVALRGEVSFDLIGRVTIPGGKRLATTFKAAPDVPVSRFSLRLFGDRKNGSVGAAMNLCSAKARNAKAALSFIGQNGKALHVKQRLRVRGCKAKASAHKRGKGAGSGGR